MKSEYGIISIILKKPIPEYPESNFVRYFSLATLGEITRISIGETQWGALQEIVGETLGETLKDPEKKNRKKKLRQNPLNISGTFINKSIGRNLGVLPK